MKAEAAFAKAKVAIPGGVNSPVRAFGAVGGAPRFISAARGPYIYDIDGKEYVDLVCTWGPALLGHAHPEVVAAVQEAAAKGLSFGAPTESETDLANAITARVPGAEQVRMVSTGTEATMTAIRLARGVTGREVIVKFAGCYHGHSDGLLAAAGSGVATQGLPGSAGVPRGTAADTLVIPYNDAAALREVFQLRGAEIAAVITEASPANMGIVPPINGFNQVIREVTSQYGALMILDEVLTGFRASPAGFWGYETGYGKKWNGAPLPPEATTDVAARQEWVRKELAAASYLPDIYTFGKVVGGGMPLAAVGGAREIMEHLAPVGAVYQAGTLSGNPLATAAGLKTLELADRAVYERVDTVAQQICQHLAAEFTKREIPYQINTAANLFSVFFGADPAQAGVHDYAAAQQQNAQMYNVFFHAMLEEGIALPPSCFEAWFVSAAHSDSALERIFAALPRAATKVAQFCSENAD